MLRAGVQADQPQGVLLVGREVPEGHGQRGGDGAVPVGQPVQSLPSLQARVRVRRTVW